MRWTYPFAQEVDEEGTADLVLDRLDEGSTLLLGEGILELGAGGAACDGCNAALLLELLESVMLAVELAIG